MTAIARSDVRRTPVSHSFRPIQKVEDTQIRTCQLAQNAVTRDPRLPQTLESKDPPTASSKVCPSARFEQLTGGRPSDRVSRAGLQQVAAPRSPRASSDAPHPSVGLCWP